MRVAPAAKVDAAGEETDAFWAAAPADLFRRFQSTPGGLDAGEAAARRKSAGPTRWPGEDGPICRR